MLHELAVSDLGVIEHLSLVLGPGMTALTGETGAGKTLVVGAIDLLVGGRADPLVVRPGAEEARVEGRFVHAGVETVLCRVVPREGRSRAYVDGRLATVAQLAEVGANLVDLHGQHAHQSLLAAATQRDALDRFAGVDLGPLHAARRHLAELDQALEALGGDARARAREVDLLRFQLAELEAAGLADPDEEAVLERRQELLDDAVAHRRAAEEAVDALSADGGAADAVGRAVHALADRAPFAEHHARLRALAAEVSDLAVEVRATGEGIEEDPATLEEIRLRRSLLRDLRRKYGDQLADVLAFAEEVSDRLVELEGRDERAAALEVERGTARATLAATAAAVGRQRRAAAPGLAEAVVAHLQDLALPRARLEVEVGADDPGDEVRFLLAANAGEPALPLAKVASGGELARTMLALRLVLSLAPPTLVFDEVDAGIGGEAALSVGRSLAALALDGGPPPRGPAAGDGEHAGWGRQVLVVTHLPQVAAFADAHVVVAKAERSGRTVASARAVEGADRVAELSRMLSGLRDSGSGQLHAAELMAAAAAHRAGPAPTPAAPRRARRTRR